MNLFREDRLDRAGMLLLRPEGDPNSAQVRNRYGKIKRHLDQLFEHHCGVLEFGAKGRVHIHMPFLARDDISTGFCKSAYTQYVAGRQGVWAGLMEPDEYDDWLRRLPRFFNPNEHLESIREQLNRRITKHGFKPVRIQDLAPFIKEPEAVAQYVTKQLWQPSSDFSRFVKGTRMIILPRSFPKPITRSFSWAGGRSKKFREKLGLIASYLGLDEVTVKVRFGKSDWMKALGFLMSKIEEKNPDWPDYRHPNFDPAEYCRELVRRHFL